MILKLPLPPSSNKRLALRKKGRRAGKFTLSLAAKQYKEAVYGRCLQQRPKGKPFPVYDGTTALAVHLWYYLPRGRKLDVDNGQKLLLDSLKMLAYPDDGCIDQLHVYRVRDSELEPHVLVCIGTAVPREPPYHLQDVP